ncbi:KaiC domain-containing protein [Halorhabdus amylolytica]|uniref:KaiC domain-containing protein n=1 Tax=Halorhabdus amylolytica TaxID=2559573 RepID=UPI0010A9CC96|nr:KaiC domain-containing protein [Halorhabdus amylolytica]
MSEDDSEDDWFEEALAEESGSDGTGGNVESSDPTDDDWFPQEDGTDDETASPVGDVESDVETGDVEPTERADTPIGKGSEAGANEGATEVDDDSLFEEDFASALASAGGPESGEDAGEGGFAEEDFDSEIPRIDLGIEGLDDMIQGGIPHRHLMVVIGAPGTGKTTFGLQFLNHGLQAGENAVFVTLEQSRESILDTANERGWDFGRYEREDRLAIVDLDPVEMANSLENIRGEFPELVREFGADRLVLDSVSLLEMMYDDQSRRRTEVFDFTRSLKAAGVTTMVTSEASEDNPYASRHGIIEYLTDAVFVLQYVRGDAQETRLAVEIQKIRNANHSRATKPYAITLDGIDVYQQASIF